MKTEAERLAELKRGYFYVADEAGNEIPGSRRGLGRCASLEEVWRIREELDLHKGDDCLVRHSEEERPDGSKWTDRLLIVAAAGLFALVLLNPPAVF